jgi:hypothetical protein
MSLHVFQKAIAKRQEALHRFHAKDLLFNAAGEALEGSNAQVPAPPDARDAWSSDGIDGSKRERAEKRKREDAETLAAVENEVAEKKAGAPPRSAEDGENVVTDFSDLRCHKRTSGPPDSRPLSEDAEPAHRLDHTSHAMVADNGNDKEKEAERLEAPRTPSAKDEDCIKSAERVGSLSDRFLLLLFRVHCVLLMVICFSLSCLPKHGFGHAGKCRIRRWPYGMWFDNRRIVIDNMESEEES